MNVDRIYTRGVISISASAAIAQAAQLMRDQQVGLLLVTGDGPDEYQGIGVLTDRDLVVSALAGGFGSDTPVMQVMTRKLDVIPASADIYEAVNLMRHAQCRRLAVTGEDGRIVGVLSVDDLIDGVAADMTHLASVMRASRRGPSPEQPHRRADAANAVDF